LYVRWTARPSALTSFFPFALAREVRSSIWLVFVTIHWLLTLGKIEVHFSGMEGSFCRFFLKYLTMPKTKKKDKMMKKRDESSKSALDQPSHE
jgi:hypothetical protein